MTKPNLNALDQIFDKAIEDQSPQNLDDWIAGKETNYEGRMVKHVLTKLGLASGYKEMLREYRSMRGENEADLTFDWFNENYPSFTVKLSSTSWVKSHELSITDLYKRFTTTLMYKKFMEAAELHSFERKSTARWGLIFPFMGLGKAILHNDTHLDIYGTRITRVFTTGEIVYLDILDDFLEAVIRDGWKPG